VHSDPGRLRQILLNLAGNAVKFTDKGGIMLRVSSLSADDNTTKMLFEVVDTGIGIPKHRLLEMFEPFEQADASTTRRFGGTGLGLAICKHLVELMGGELGARSEPGGGSTFWFTLPMAKQVPRPDPQGTPEADLAGVRILVFCDSENNRRMLGALLGSWRCRCTQAHSGEQAVSLLEKAADEADPFQIAILDLVMPGGDGESLACVIKDRPKIESTRLIAMPSVGQRGDAARFRRLGFSGYLPKPLRSGYLRDCLRTVLGVRQEVPATLPNRGQLVTRHSIDDGRRHWARVLVAEDSAVNQKVLLAMLEKLSCQADAVNNGYEAVRALEASAYDLVLMDCQMPGMDGYEATRTVRGVGSRVRNRSIPIVAVTAHALAGDRERCIAAGMDDYITKPVTLAALAAALKKWCQSFREESSAAVADSESSEE
jgi:CheY-like chemotaxis protein